MRDPVVRLIDAGFDWAGNDPKKLIALVAGLLTTGAILELFSPN